MLTVMHVVCVCVVYVVIKCNVALSVYKKTTFLCVFFFCKNEYVYARLHVYVNGMLLL